MPDSLDPGTKPVYFVANSHNWLKLLKKMPLILWCGSQNLGLVIKSNADFFNIGSGYGSVWQRITIFEIWSQGGREPMHSQDTACLMR